METSLPCRCGNMKIKAKAIPQNVTPNLQTSERDRLSQCRQVFMCDGRCIEIASPNTVQVKTNSPVSADIGCASCKTFFRFFLGAGMQVYIGYLPQSVTSAIYSSNTPESAVNKQQVAIRKPGIPKNFPNFLQPYVIPNTQANTHEASQPRRSSSSWDDLNRNENGEDAFYVNTSVDDDFDMMFSNKIDPVVGSYRANMCMPIENMFDNAIKSRFSPSSYYA